MAEDRITSTRMFVPNGLSRAQIKGRSCVSCGKRWPRPRRPVGRVLGGGELFACDDCRVVAEPVWQDSTADRVPFRS